MSVYFTSISSILRPFGNFCGHLVTFVDIWQLLWPFGNFCGHLEYFMVTYLVNFSLFGMFYLKNLATLLGTWKSQPTHVWTYITTMWLVFYFFHVFKMMPCVPTYLPTYLHTYIHTYIHTYLKTYVHGYTKLRLKLKPPAGGRLYGVKTVDFLNNSLTFWHSTNCN
jgi:hypothetical protein